MHNAIAAAQLLADSSTRSAALHAVAEILERLARWDTADPVEQAKAEAEGAAAWALNAAILGAAGGAGWAGPLRDAVVELRAAAGRPDPGLTDGVNPHTSHLEAP